MPAATRRKQAKTRAYLVILDGEEDEAARGRLEQWLVLLVEVDLANKARPVLLNFD